MLKSNLAIFTLLLFFLSGCSESIRELESRIKKQAEKNNTEMSAMEIKQTAIYLNEWSEQKHISSHQNKLKLKNYLLHVDKLKLFFYSAG